MRTYGARSRKSLPASESIASSSDLSETTTPTPTKRPFEPSEPNRSTKRARSSVHTTKKSKPTGNSKQKSLIQLHFSIDQSILRRCPLCDLRYTHGAADDVALHKAHCARVQKGMEWSKEEDREGYGTSITEVKSRAKLTDGRTGRIISFPANVGGKIGNKLASLLQTVNLCLSAPALSKPTMQSSKVYLFLLPQNTISKAETIVGCVVAERIETAMDVISSGSASSDEPEESVERREVAGIFCDPHLRPTAMGISRMFVSSKHRRQGIARTLLVAAAETFIPGCPLDPLKGQIAFSQPTGDGNRVMQSWGRGQIRIYEED